MILRYNNFIVESTFQECCTEYGTFGRWVEKEVEGNDYLSTIIAPFISKVKPDIRLANAVDLLGEFDQKQIYLMIKSEKEKKNENTSNENLGGKNIFKSFLKATYSLGIGDLDKKASSEYLIYYESNSINDDLILQSFTRFKSLQVLYKKTIENQECKLFFGVDLSLNFTYGILTVSGRIILGTFKFNKSSFEWTKSLGLNIFSKFKMDIIELSWDDFSLLIKVAKFMQAYPLGDKSKFNLIWSQYILTFSYYGVSKWDNGVLDAGEYMNIKSNLKTRLSSESWSKRVLVNVSADDFYLKISFKLK